MANIIGKKGFEVQLHWIFVMIAGALILSFFFLMASKQRSLSQTKLEATLSSDVESVLVGAMVSKGVAQSLPSIPQGLSFECSSGCDCRISIGRASVPFDNKVIFSPFLLEDRPSVVWSVDWKFPYRVANFLYLTNPDFKYYFVYDDSQLSASLHERLVRNIPPPIMAEGNIPAQVDFSSVRASELQSVQAGDHRHTRFVFVNVDILPVSDSFRRESFDAVRLIQHASPRVEFYENDGAGFKFITQKAYAGLPSLYAAVFAENVDMYKCGLQTAFKRMVFVSDIFEERASGLEANTGPDCTYLAIQGLFSDQASLASQLSEGIDSSIMPELDRLQSQIARENRRLVEQSCPELF